MVAVSSATLPFTFYLLPFTFYLFPFTLPVFPFTFFLLPYSFPFLLLIPFVLLASRTLSMRP